MQQRQTADNDIEKRYEQFRLQNAKNNTELKLMQKSKPTAKNRKNTGSIKNKNKVRKVRKVRFDDDIEIIPPVSSGGIINTLTNTASMAISSTVDVIIIIGLYQVLSMESIEKLYSTPLKRYFYSDDEMKKKSYMGYGIKFIMTIILYIIIKLLIFG